MGGTTAAQADFRSGGDPEVVLASAEAVEGGTVGGGHRRPASSWRQACRRRRPLERRERRGRSEGAADRGGRGSLEWPVVRTIDWGDGAVVIIDQTALPQELRTLRITEVDDLVDAIRRLAVRGAPALGAAGALGVLLAVRQGSATAGRPSEVGKAVDRVRHARPTAVNLAWGVDRAPRPELHRGRRGASRPRRWRPRRGRRRQPGHGRARRRPAHRALHPAGGRRRGPAHPHPLQRRRAGLRRVGHRARRGPHPARAGPRRPGSTRTRPGRCCRAPASPPGSWTGWASTTGSWSTAPGRR